MAVLLEENRRAAAFAELAALIEVNDLIGASALRIVLPLPIVHLAPRRLVEKEDVGAVEPRGRQDEAHDGIRLRGREGRGRYGDGTALRQQQANAQAVRLSLHRFRKRAPRRCLVEGEGEIVR